MAMQVVNPATGEKLATVATANEDEVDRSQAGFLQFTPPSATIVDLSASLELSSHLALTAGLYNLLNETYWNWGDVRGLDASSPTLDRYTQPGFHYGASLRYRL